MKWKANLTERAEKVLVRMQRGDCVRVLRALQEIEEDPFAGDVKWLESRPPSLRRRVGAWRILYRLHTNEQMVDVYDIIRRTTTSYRKK